MGRDAERRVSVRLPKDVTDWLDGQVLDKKRDGVASTVTREVEIAIRQRMISKLGKAEREKVFRRLGVRKREDDDDGHDSGNDAEAGDGLLRGDVEDDVGAGEGDVPGATT